MSLHLLLKFNKEIALGSTCPLAAASCCSWAAVRVVVAIVRPIVTTAAVVGVPAVLLALQQQHNTS